jgi:hypothetical protein
LTRRTFPTHINSSAVFVSALITIPGIRDHNRLEYLITIPGMRTVGPQLARSAATPSPQSLNRQYRLPLPLVGSHFDVSSVPE